MEGEKPIDRLNMKPEIREEVEAMIERRGGIEAFVREMEEGLEFSIRVQAEFTALEKKYPDKWVAISKDGRVFVGDSVEEVLDAVDAQGIGRDDIRIEFLDTDPAPLII